LHSERWGDTIVLTRDAAEKTSREQVRAILHEIAGRLHVPVSHNHLMQAHRSLNNLRTKWPTNVAAALPVKEPPPNDWGAFLIMASRTLKYLKRNIDLVDFKQRLDTHHSSFDDRNINPMVQQISPALASCKRACKGTTTDLGVDQDRGA
jgi:hypothetical protein